MVGCPTGVTSTVCTNTLAAGARCSVRYVYNASAPHSVQAVFTAEGNTNRLVHTVDLKALIPNVVSVVASQSSDLPPATPYVAPLGKPTYVTVTFINHAAKAVEVTAVIGHGDPNFRTTTNQCVGRNGQARTLQPNEECVVSGELTPSTAGTKTLTLTLYEANGDKATWTGTVNVKPLTMVIKKITKIKEPQESAIARALVQLTDGTLMAGTVNGDSPLLSSTDSGANWTPVANFPLARTSSLAFSSGVLYALSGSVIPGFAVSSDNGLNWVDDSANLPTDGIFSIAANSNNVYINSDGMLFINKNQGKGPWQKINLAQGAFFFLNTLFVNANRTYAKSNFT